MSTTIVAEIGINHNGCLAFAKEMIDAAYEAGADVVKFQKRTLPAAVPIHQRHALKETPWGQMTYLDYRNKLEFGFEEYCTLDRWCARYPISWTASVWDAEAAKFIAQFDVPYLKIPSAAITDARLLDVVRATGKPVVMSTGMSTLEEVDAAINVLMGSRYCDGDSCRRTRQLPPAQLTLLHCVSTYPTAIPDINLRVMDTLRAHTGLPVGYSGHEVGMAVSIAAVARGACMIERHFTTSQTMWGTDQRASMEPGDFAALVNGIRSVERALGDGVKIVCTRELPIRQKLRGV